MLFKAEKESDKVRTVQEGCDDPERRLGRTSIKKGRSSQKSVGGGQVSVGAAVLQYPLNAGGHKRYLENYSFVIRISNRMRRPPMTELTLHPRAIDCSHKMVVNLSTVGAW